MKRKYTATLRAARQRAVTFADFMLIFRPGKERPGAFIFFMKMRRQKFMELLAPAGSFDALCAAVQSGADAVYIGGSRFSARRSAVNFTMDEIRKAVRYCHLRQVKLHVAANILIKEREAADFLAYAEELAEAGVDALIIQDLGMAAEVKKRCPKLALHASTQLTAASAEAVNRLYGMGFSRVVLSRELSAGAIREICRSAEAEIEVFAHGAICMCYSGQCLMSSVIGGRSGNRGMCAQPCRLPYELDGKKGYLLSPKDLCMADYIGELAEMGVDSIKLEGRLKRSEYTAAVTGIYRKYIDSPRPLSAADRAELAAAFNRSGFTAGYFEGKTGKGMMSYENPGNASENVFSDEVKNRCRPDANLRKSRIFMSARLALGEPLTLSVWDENGNFAEATGSAAAEAAVNRPLDAKRLSAQLVKLGATPFFTESPELDLEDGASLPVSEINAVRRAAVGQLEEEICRAAAASAEEKRPAGELFPGLTKKKTEPRTMPLITAEVYTYEQAAACIKAGAEVIYAPTALANRLYSEGACAEIIAKLPPVYRADKKSEKPLTPGILISNIGQAEEGKRLYGDFRLNITNTASKELFGGFERITLSPELNLAELTPVSEGCEVIAYGALPLMVMENCPLRAQGKCQSFTMKHSLIDRRKEKFPIRCAEGCYAELLNSKPVYMADKLTDLKKLKINAIRLIFTVENSAECDKIVREYKMALMDKNVNMPRENTFTRGHFYRGVE